MPTAEEYAQANPSRAQVLQEAERLITGDRNVSYGTPTQNFENIAELWNVRFAHKLGDSRFTASDVADAMILLKVARNIAQVKRDGYVDIAGYAACGWEAHESWADRPAPVQGVVRPEFIENPTANDQRTQNA